MQINTQNVLGVNYQLSKTSAAISRSLERLSTGRRVNSPRDDQAAYSMGVEFESQVRGLTQANLNINQTQGLLQTADSAFESQLDLLQRMREIAVQASSGTLTSTERTNLNTELQQLLEEYRRIVSDTEFNGQKLIDGSFTTTDFQIGANFDQTIEFDVDSTEASEIFRKDVGSGTFKTRTTLVGGTGPYAIATGDFNGDGNEDFVASEVGSSNNQAVLAIYDGKGDGTFQVRRTITGGTDTRQIPVADVNGDSILDLVSTDFDDDTVSVLINNGDGTFQARTTVLTGTGPTDIELADFNGDGNLDIVTANNQGTTSGTSVYFGQGNGSFTIQSTLTTGADAFSVAVGDWNRDGFKDIAVLNQTGAGTISIFTNNGVGQFTAGSALTVTTTTEKIRVGDINNDGADDIISANQGSNNLSVFLSNGNATFTTGTTITTAANEGGYDVRLSDLNNDGVLDIITPSSGASGGTSFSGISIIMALTNNVTAESDVSVITQTKAERLISIVDSAIESINGERANLAAVHNRLEESLAVNLLLLDDYSEALSKAVDVDVALETADLVKNQVLQQAQVAVAAQANLQMQTVLGLLRF